MRRKRSNGGHSSRSNSRGRTKTTDLIVNNEIEEPFPQVRGKSKTTTKDQLKPCKSSDQAQLRSRANSVFSFIFDKISVHQPRKDGSKGFSLYKLLLLELNLNSNDTLTLEKSTDSMNDNHFEELQNMIKIPFCLEKFMIFGLLVCLNSFLSLFTLAPLKVLIISSQSAYQFLTKQQTFQFCRFRLIKKDVITLSIIILSIVVLSNRKLDISRMYHDVRGQTDIKLYVMFGVLECAEKLCSSIGQDILNVLYESSPNRNIYRFASFYLLSTFYLSFHAYILIYQTVSLNVAANSYSNALMTLLLSNQFSELKSSVFKKFEREGLFQITMADLTERFQLSLMLGIIALKNLLQLSVTGGLIPNSWKSWNRWVGAVFGPSVVVIGSEIFVDWIKHCFIAKFNKIRPKVYKNFLYVLCLDFLEVFKSNTKSGKSSHEFTDYIVLTRRIGLPLLASVVCFLRMILADLKHIFVFPVAGSNFYAIITSGSLIVLTFFTLLLTRVILCMLIFKIANVLVTQHKQHQEKLRKKLNDSRSVAATRDYLLEGTPSPPDNRTNDTSIDINDSAVGTYLSSPLGLSFLPGSPNTEPSTINPTTRAQLYDADEKIPPTIEEKRNKQLLQGVLNEDSWCSDSGDEGLSQVMRYKMSSKRIW